MAQANVKLSVDARSAVSSLNNTTLATNKLSAAAKGTTASLSGTSAAAKGLAASLTTTLGPIIALGAAFSTLSSGLRAFSDRERDVAILRQGLENLNAGTNVLKELQEAADRFGKTTLFDQEEFTRGFNLLTSFRKIGVDSYEQIAEAAANVAQLNQTDLSTSFMQLAKALEDPERNLSTLNRSGISFTKDQQKVIKELMKTNRTLEAHTLILDIVNKAYNKTAEAAAVGFAGSLDTLGEEFRDFAEIIGKALVPVLDTSVKALTAFLQFLNSEGGQAAAIIGGITLAAKGLSVVLPLVHANFIAIRTSALIATGSLTGMNATLMATKAGFANAAVAATTFKVALAKTGIGLAIISFGALVTKILEAVNAQKKFNELLDTGSSLAIQKEIDKTKKVIDDLEEKISVLKKNVGWLYREDNTFEDQLKKAREELEKLEKRLPITQGVELFREFEKTKKTLEEKNKELKKILERSKLETEEEKKAFDIEQRRLELVEKYGEEVAQTLLDIEEDNRKLQKGVDILKKKEEAAKALKKQYEQIGQSIENSIVSNLADAVEGTKTLAEAAINVLNKLKRKLIEVAIQRAISGFNIGGSIGDFLKDVFKAEGGPVNRGRSYIVGERGPEMFVPNTSGTIVPNNSLAMGGGGVTNVITVNVDSSSSDVQSNDGQANQFGEALAAAIQAELINQKRAGGLLSNT